MFVFQDRGHLPFVYPGQLASNSNQKPLLLQSKKKHVAAAEYVRDRLRTGLPIIAQDLQLSREKGFLEL